MAKRLKPAAASRMLASARRKAAKATSTRKSKTKKAPRAKPAKLGRPKITGDELLFLLFKEDYHARQIFEFLRVEKVKDLEQYSPQQIVRLLSRPITETVDRIRRKLAEKNRCLREDEQFAAQARDADS